MKRILVEKYGGTSVGSVDRIKTIARNIVARRNNGYKMVVVVSAMGKTTDNLLAMVDQLAPTPRHRELSMLLSTGEIITCSLLAMAIQSLGAKATSLTGPQGGIHADEICDEARIMNIDTTRINELLEQDEIIVMAGYQGKVGDEITVLGRGGSDASAIALAAALQADYCHIYTDVKGIYTADPRNVKDASLLKSISYEEMIELAASGANVMMGRSIEIARKYELKITVSSSFENTGGTLITKEKELEKVVITGVAANKNVAMIDIFDVKSNSNEILKYIATEKINIVLLCSNRNAEKNMNLSVIIKPDYINKIQQFLDHYQSLNKINKYSVDMNVAQVAIVGSGIANHCGVAFEMFDCLTKNKIDILMTSTSEIKITAIIPKDKANDAVQLLHNQFNLNTLQRNLVENKDE